MGGGEGEKGGVHVLSQYNAIQPYHVREAWRRHQERYTPMAAFSVSREVSGGGGKKGGVHVLSQYNVIQPYHIREMRT